MLTQFKNVLCTQLVTMFLFICRSANLDGFLAKEGVLARPQRLPEAMEGTAYAYLNACH